MGQTLEEAMGFSLPGWLCISDVRLLYGAAFDNRFTQSDGATGGDKGGNCKEGKARLGNMIRRQERENGVTRDGRRERGSLLWFTESSLQPHHLVLIRRWMFNTASEPESNKNPLTSSLRDLQGTTTSTTKGQLTNKKTACT